MSLIFNNLSRPGEELQDGDWMEVIHPNGTIERKFYHAPRIPSEEEVAEQERSWRDYQLEATDWIVPITDHPQHAAYMTYRQALRDWPSTADFPDTRPELGA